MAVDPFWANTTLLLSMDGANNSTTFTDRSQFARAVTASGSAKVSTVRSKFGGAAANFAGSGGLSVAASADFTFGAGDFTWECWANFTNSTLGTLVSCWSNYTWYKDSSNNLSLYDHNTATNVVAAAISLDEWHHCALSRVAGTLYMHIDGVQVASVVHTRNIPSTNLLVGINGTADAPLYGYIDELRITTGVGRYIGPFEHPMAPFPTDVEVRPAPTYDADLSKVALLLGFEAQNGRTTVVDGSLRPKPAPFVFGDARQRVTQSKFGVSSLYFDGAADAVLFADHADLHLPGDFTIELWVFPVYNGGFLLNRGGGVGIGYASYEIVYTAGSWYFAASSANTGYDIGSEGGSDGNLGTLTTGEWHHLAVTCQGNTYRGFSDGVLKFTQTVAAHPQDTAPRGLALGGTFISTWPAATPGSSFFGYMDELRITNGLARYTSGFTPPAAAFPRYAGKVSGVVTDSTGGHLPALALTYREATMEVVSVTESDPVTGVYELPTRHADEHTVVVHPPAADPALPLQAQVYNSVIPSP